MSHIALDNPLAWIVGLPLAAAVLLLLAFGLRRQGRDPELYGSLRCQMAFFNSSTRERLSQLNSSSSRPKWP